MKAPLVDRAVAFLLQQTEPLLLGDVCERIGITRGMSSVLRGKLLRHLGDKLVETARHDSGRKYCYYAVVGAAMAPRRERRLTVPDDLYRGWRNPKTGITGARLGVDL